jgi:hypothetical protein
MQTRCCRTFYLWAFLPHWWRASPREVRRCGWIRQPSAFLGQNGVITDLNTLIPLGSSLYLLSANDASAWKHRLTPPCSCVLIP